mgnify:CR=1 FL=1
MTNPKLALIPSGYKGGTSPTVYSILPSDGSGDFTFDRASEGTRVRKDGLIEEVSNDVPRLDWSDGNCPSLLSEPQRTNLLNYSEDLTNAVWTLLSDGTGTNPVVTANYSIAPNGTLTADRVVFDKGGGTSGSDYSIIRQFVSGTAQRVSSIYMKSNTNENYNIGVDDTGTVDVVTVTPQWQRFKHSGSSKSRLQLSLRQSQTSDFADVSIWGGQLEDGTYPTSYIKTEASAVTRLKDECINGGDSDLFDITEGTFFVDSYVYNSGNFTTISLSDGSVSNRLILIFQNYGTQVRVLSSGGVDSFLNLTFDQRNKIAVTFKENEYKFFINGALVGSDTSATVPSGIDRLNFSDNTNAANHFEGKVYDTRVYDRVLTEAEAIELTTL